MIKKHRALLARLLFFGDLFVMLISWILAYYLRFYLDFIPATKGIYSFSYHMSLAIVILAIWGIALQFSGLYKFQRLTSRSEALKKILNACVIGTLTFIATTYLFQEYRFSRGVIGYFFVTSISLLYIFRIFFRELIFYLRRNGYNLRHIIIVGNGELAQTTAKKIQEHTETGVNIVGFVALDKVHELPDTIKELGLDQIVIAIDAGQYSELEKVLTILRHETIDIKIVPDFYRYASLRCDLEELDGMPFITLNDTPMDGWSFLLKRITDIVLGSLFLIVSFPMMLLVGMLIKIFSPGPIFYKQERVGLDGTNFVRCM